MARPKTLQVVQHTQHPTPPPRPVEASPVTPNSYVQRLLHRVQVLEAAVVEAREERDALVYILGRLEHARQRQIQERANKRNLRRVANIR